jgi:hypothetical protein
MWSKGDTEMVKHRNETKMADRDVREREETNKTRRLMRAGNEAFNRTLIS